MSLGDELGWVERTERLAQEHADQVGVLQVGGDGGGDAWILHLDGDRPLVTGVGVADHRPMDLPDRRRGDRYGVPLQKDLLRRAAELLGDHLSGQFAAHRRGVGLQLGEGVADRFGQPVVEIARHLADLHQRPLEVAEALGHLLGGAQLPLGIDLDPSLGGREQLARRRRGVRRSDPDADARQLKIAR